MTTARYRVTTWDRNKGTFTPQKGLDRWDNLTLWEVRAALRALQCMGYSCHRVGDASDPSVYVERVDD